MNVDTTLRRALAQLEAQRNQIDNRIEAIRAVIGPGGRKRTAGRRPRRRARRRRGRKPMSASARRAVSARMKKYWATRKAKG